ncbi:MAG: PAS domain-containing sensor histidine kinase [Candidatus Moranbacteria bacterium]|nr:PAS domain-containing sensor histidine kinase [Candidatus Moranbacteria bacterium]
MKRAMFAALMQSTPDSIVFADLSGRYVEVSQKKADNWGRTCREMIGLTDFDLMDEEEAKIARADSLGVINTGKSITNCIRSAIRNGETVWYSLSEQPWLDDEGNIIGTISITRNITEREKLREALFLFFSDAAHKLKSPFTTINGMLARIIKGRYGKINDPSVMNALTIVSKECAIIEKRAHDSLDYIGTLCDGKTDLDPLSKIEMIDVGKDIFNYVLEEKTLLLEENNVFIDGTMGLISPGEVFVNADIKKLRAVIEEFTDNSTKYGKNGRNSVSISYGFWYEDEKLFINFYNDGPGINKQFLDNGLLCKAFERADETSTAAEGTGLGMHMVEQYMKMMGGGFEYTETAEGHPNFIIWLPVSE